MSVHTQITKQIRLADISMGANVRTYTGLDKESISQLAASIKAHGLLQPIVVRPLTEGEGSGYTLIAGQRRTHACVMAGMSEVPAVIVTTDEAGAMTKQLVENLEREQLSLSETAEAVRALLALHGKPATVSDVLKRSKAWVSKHLSVTAPNFSEPVRELVRAGECADLETALLLNQIAKHKDGGAALPKLLDDVKAGRIGRQKVKDALDALKTATAGQDGEGEEEGEGEGEGDDEPKGRATITFELSAEQAEQFEALGGAQWLRRQLKRLKKATA